MCFRLLLSYPRKIIIFGYCHRNHTLTQRREAQPSLEGWVCVFGYCCLTQERSLVSVTVTVIRNPNRLGSVIGMVGGTGANFGVLTDQYLYSPYGIEEPLAASGNPFRYTGRYYDGETGLYYYRSRYYNAGTGRFLEPDSILYAGGLNLYAYVGNNPINNVDPLGTCFQYCAALGKAIDRFAYNALYSPKVFYGNVDIQATIIFGLSLDFSLGFAVERTFGQISGVQLFGSHSALPNAALGGEYLGKGYHGAAGINFGFANGSFEDFRGLVDATSLDFLQGGGSVFSPNIDASRGLFGDFRQQASDAFNGVPGAGAEFGIGEGLGVSQGAQQNRPIFTLRNQYSPGYGAKGFAEFGDAKPKQCSRAGTRIKSENFC